MAVAESPARPSGAADDRPAGEVQALLRLIEACDEAADVGALAAALNAALDLLSFEAAALMLPDGAGELRCRAHCQLSAAAIAALDAHAPCLRAATVELRDPLSPSEQGLGALAAADDLTCAALAPVPVEGETAGHLVLLGKRPLLSQDPTSIATVAAQLGRALSRLHLREVAANARAAAERNADRMRRLVRMTAALTTASSGASVAELITQEALEAVGADSTGVYLFDERKSRLDLIASHGMAPGMVTQLRSFPIETENPLCVAVRLNEPVWVERWEEFRRRFPASEERVRKFPKPGPMAFGCVPLRIEDQTIGGIALTYFSDRHFDEDERAFVSLFAQHCAQGIERARLYERALAAIRVRDDFLSVAGHELRTPLSTLLLQTQFMSEASDDAPGLSLRERFAPVQRTLRRLIKLADDVLDVSRIRAGRLSIEVEPLELCALVRDVVTRTVEGMRRGGREVRVVTDGPIDGRWDPLRIEQILVNLITNASKYGAGSPIDVRVGPCESGAEIVVRDYGIGIAPADHLRIFERFERSVERREFAGLGLGLWIVREIVQAHGGSISVRSDLGQGAAFSVILPLAPPDQPSG